MGLADVELPENFSSPTTESAPTGSGTEISPDGQAPSGTETVSRQAAKSEAPESKYLDLDKLERFRFGGRDYTPKELKSAILRHEDYSRKTMETAEARKYAENFTTDLQAVLDNPALFAKFRGVYPKAYVEAAQRIIERINGQGIPKEPTQQTGARDPQFDKEFSSIKDEFSEIKKSLHQAEVQKVQAWLDNQYDTLGKKYPHADHEVITARAEAANAQGVEITDKVLEKLFKAHHTEVQSRWEKVYKEKVDQQVKAGSKAKDVGTGGGVPGTAPRGKMTLDQATKMFLEDIAASKRK